MSTMFARRRRPRWHTEISAGTILIAIVAGLLPVFATSRSAAEG